MIRFRYQSTALAIVTIACIGCASGAPNKPREYNVQQRDDIFVMRLRRDARVIERDYPVPADKVWDAVPAVFSDLGFKGEPSVSTDSRVYFTPELTIKQQLFTGEANSLYLDCGRTPSRNAAADEYAVRFAILLRVKPVTDASSHVEVMMDGRAHDRTQSSTSLVFCTGTGKLEQTFIQQLGKRLATR